MYVLNDAVIGENKARMAPMSHSPINFIRPVEKVLNLLLRFLELRKKTFTKNAMKTLSWATSWVI